MEPSDQPDDGFFAFSFASYLHLLGLDDMVAAVAGAKSSHNLL